MENIERDFKGIWIPKEIWLLKGISIIEKCLLVEINSLDNENGCFASNKYFAEFFEISEVNISKHITKLKLNGYIRQTYFDGRKRILRSNIKISLNDFDKTPLMQPLKQVNRKHKASLNENIKYNNIDNKQDSNIIINNKSEESNLIILEKLYIESIKHVIPEYDEKTDYNYPKNRATLKNLINKHGMDKMLIMLERYFKNGVGAKTHYALTSIQVDWIWNELLQNKKVKQNKDEMVAGLLNKIKGEEHE